ncbi:YbhB/YbcL family Raf kinase inhibitor-like protein, partial [Neisseria meningitidis]|nr:YbhB/YbcL family Raf kinase inhibitor-like protein [Neisseria meningitidis]
MQTRILSAVLLAFSTAAFAGGAFTLQFDNPSEDGGFTQNQLLSAPYGFGCSGGNASPALSWKNPPAGTKSFVLTVYDKDAPTGLGWMHRVVADIPADVHRRNATSLQLSRCANIADRTGLDALGGR